MVIIIIIIIIIIIDTDGRKMADAEPSPVWVPDSDAPKCMHCLKSEFTVINRRVTVVLSTTVTDWAVTQYCEIMLSVIINVLLSSLSLSLSLRFNGHFPGEPGLAGVY